MSKADKICESGLISTDGRMRLPMDRLNEFFAAHKGERIVIQIEAVPQHSTAAQQAYFYNYILPTIVQAYRENGYRYSDRDVERELMNLYPETITVDGHYIATRAAQLSQAQMSDFLEWLKQFAAENLSVYIEDPRVI